MLISRKIVAGILPISVCRFSGLLSVELFCTPHNGVDTKNLILGEKAEMQCLVEQCSLLLRILQMGHRRNDALEATHGLFTFSLSLLFSAFFFFFSSRDNVCTAFEPELCDMNLYRWVIYRLRERRGSGARSKRLDVKAVYKMDR